MIPELAGEVAATVATMVCEGRGAALEQVGERARMHLPDGCPLLAPARVALQ